MERATCIVRQGVHDSSILRPERDVVHGINGHFPMWSERADADQPCPGLGNCHAPPSGAALLAEPVKLRITEEIRALMEVSVRSGFSVGFLHSVGPDCYAGRK